MSAKEGEEELLEQFWAANSYVAGCYDESEDFESLMEKMAEKEKECIPVEPQENMSHLSFLVGTCSTKPPSSASCYWSSSSPYMPTGVSWLPN